MSTPFPIKRETSVDPDSVMIVELDDEEAAALESLSSEMARDILATLKQDPKPASEIASDLDTSLQNVNYHLRRLEDADLITSVDVWYSQTGNEMDVYGPTHNAIVVLTGEGSRTVELSQLAGAIAGIVALLGGASLLIRRWMARQVTGGTASAPMEYADQASRSAESAAKTVATQPADPGYWFFAGGAFVLGLVLVLGLLFVWRSR